MAEVSESLDAVRAAYPKEPDASAFALVSKYVTTMYKAARCITEPEEDLLKDIYSCCHMGYDPDRLSNTGLALLAHMGFHPKSTLQEAATRESLRLTALLESAVSFKIDYMCVWYLGALKTLRHSKQLRSCPAQTLLGITFNRRK